MQQFATKKSDMQQVRQKLCKLKENLSMNSSYKCMLVKIQICNK